MKSLVALTGLAVIMAAPMTVAAAEVGDIKISGDLRVRHQNDDDASRDGDRDRKRIRARIQAVGQATEEIEVGIGLASGSSDPVSTNQTIQGFGESKGINLDLAYFKVKTGDNSSVLGGKFKNNLAKPGKSQLQWDGDWRPEGLGGNYKNGIYFANALYTWLNGEQDDRVAGAEEDDITLAAVQVGVNTEVAGAKVKAGVGYNTADTKGQPCYDGCSQNTTDGMGMYLTDYSVFEAFAEAGLEVASQPLKIWVQYINNGDAEAAPSGEKLDSGVQIGAQIGKAKKKGTWQGKIYYQDLDADATLAALSNSDFAGGGTDNEGIYIGGAYALTDKSTVNFSYFAAEDKNERSGAPAQDYDTLQLDIKFKF